MKEEDCVAKFREEVRQALDGGEVRLDDWGTIAKGVRKLA